MTSNEAIQENGPINTISLHVGSRTTLKDPVEYNYSEEIDLCSKDLTIHYHFPTPPCILQLDHIKPDGC